MMAGELSWADAREAARALMEPDWTPDMGTMDVSPEGWEDEETFWVNVTAREWAVGGDDRYLFADQLAVLVWKHNGHADAFNPIQELDRLAIMRPVPKRRPPHSRSAVD